MTPERARNLGFNLPDDWYVHRIDGDPAADVDARIRERPGLAPHREQILMVLSSFADEADSKGALIAASYWEPLDSGPAVANVTLLEARRQASHDVGVELVAVERGLARPGDADVGARDVERIDLPLGPAVRLRVLATAPGSGGVADTVVLALAQYWVPVPGRPDMVVLSGTTPRLDAAQEFGDIFDSMAESLRFVEVEDE